MESCRDVDCGAGGDCYLDKWVKINIFIALFTIERLNQFLWGIHCFFTIYVFLLLKLKIGFKITRNVSHCNEKVILVNTQFMFLRYTSAPIGLSLNSKGLWVHPDIDKLPLQEKRNGLPLQGGIYRFREHLCRHRWLQEGWFRLQR